MRAVLFSVILIILAAVSYGISIELWTTDADGNIRNDFEPGEIVFVHGTGFNAFATIEIMITRPDGAVESCNSNACNSRYLNGLQTSDSEGNFAYEYDLNGITGEYVVDVTDGINTAQTTFTDARIINNATLNGTFNILVEANAVINATVNVTTTGSGSANDWESTSYIIKPNGTLTCVNTPNHLASGTFIESFIINGPALPGTYNISFRAHNGNVCSASGQSAIFTLIDGITVRLKVEPIKDAKVAMAQRNANFGTARYMMINDKFNAVDRSYLGFDLASTGINSTSDANLDIYVYQTGNQVIGSIIEAWYCENVDFNELAIKWSNQPSNWNKNGALLTGNCVLADNYTVTNLVVAGLPETKHTWNLTEAVNLSLASDKKFTIVLKHDAETFSTNAHHVQYLAREYPESKYRPKLVIS